MRPLAIVLALLALAAGIAALFLLSGDEAPPTETVRAAQPTRDVAPRQTDSVALETVVSSPSTGPGPDAPAVGDDQRVAAASTPAEELADEAGLAAGEAELVLLLLSRETEAPVAGIHVALRANGAEYPEDFEDDARGGPEAVRRTDDEGRARFVVPASAPSSAAAAPETWEVGVRRRFFEAFDVVGHVLADAAGSSTTHVFHITTELDVPYYARVVSETDGAPIAGATVEVRSAETEYADGRHMDRSELWLTAASQPGGLVELRRASFDRTNAVVRAAGWSTAIVPLEEGHATPDDPLVLRLARSASLAVTLTDASGVGLADHRVVVWTQSREVTVGRPLFGSLRAGDPTWELVTGADGRATFAELPARAKLRLEVFAGDELVRREADPIVLAPGEAVERELRLGAGAAVRGLLVDQHDVPVAEHPVWRMAQDASWVLDRWHASRAVDRTTTDRQGRFELADVPAGTWKIGPGANADPEPELSTLVEEVVVPANTTHVDIVLRAHRGLYVEGTVVGPDGSPVANASLFGRATEGRWWGNTQSGDDGAFRLGPLVPGSFLIKASARGDVTGESADVRADAGTQGVIVSIAAGGNVTCLVVDAQTGEPAAAEVLYAPMPGQNLPRSTTMTRTRDDGRFEIDGAAPGRYGVVARTSDGRVGVTRDVEVLAGVTDAEAVVEIDEGAILVVRWTGDEIEWWGNVRDASMWVAWVQGTGGTTNEVAVPPGTYSITLTAADAEQEQQVTLTTGERREVAFDPPADASPSDPADDG